VSDNACIVLLLLIAASWSVARAWVNTRRDR
jgi:hypothetical protein